MDGETEESVDAILCFDANLPKMEKCTGDCKTVKTVLCPHRFNFKSKITYCNTPRFYKWPDSEILLYFLDYVRDNIKDGSALATTLFVILTKDVDFLKDAEYELRRDIRGNNLDFSGNFVTCGDIVIFIKTIDCKNYGTKGRDNLGCAIYKMNNFFKKLTRA